MNTAHCQISKLLLMIFLCICGACKAAPVHSRDHTHKSYYGLMVGANERGESFVEFIQFNATTNKEEFKNPIGRLKECNCSVERNSESSYILCRSQLRNCPRFLELRHGDIITPSSPAPENNFLGKNWSMVLSLSALLVLLVFIVVAVVMRKTAQTLSSLV